LPSRINWVVPVGTGVAGEIVAAMVTAVPCATIADVKPIVVVLGWVAALRVKDEEAETED